MLDDSDSFSPDDSDKDPSDESTSGSSDYSNISSRFSSDLSRFRNVDSNHSSSDSQDELFDGSSESQLSRFINSKSDDRYDETTYTFLNDLQENRNRGWERFEVYLPLLKYWCKPFRFDDHRVEDIISNLRLKVCKKIGNFERKRKGSFRAWLKTIIVNLCRDETKRKQNHQTVYTNEELEGLIRNVSEIDESIEVDIIYKSVIEFVMSQYERRDWNIFIARVIEGKDPKIIAMEHDVTRNNVYRITSKILRHLREEFSIFDEEDNEGDASLPPH